VTPESGAPGLARGGGAHYLGPMPLPRPASPRALVKDIRAFLGQRSRYQLVSFAVALAMPIAILWLFVLDSNNMKPGPRITFVESYPLSRSDDEIRAAQLARQRAEAARAEQVRQRWKQLGDRTGVN
jgi:hypothetical protein